MDERPKEPREAEGGNGAPAWRLAAEGVRVGTASWTDKTLLTPGLFYPKGVSTPAERLRYYASCFPIVEVDSSYYSLPAERNARLWADRTPEGFRFNVKAFSLLTGHPTRPQGLPKDLREALPAEAASKQRFYDRDVPTEIIEEAWLRFCTALAPLARAGKLAAVLFQFPEWFPPSRASREHILACRDRLAEHLPGVACAVELRQRAWMEEPERQRRTLEFLTAHELPYVCVDMPQGFRTSIPPVAAATAPLALIRFHGRRAEVWGQRGVGVTERFRYDYSSDELAEWVPRARRLARDAHEVHVLMNNCYRDYAVRSARTFAQLVLSPDGRDAPGHA